MKARTFAALVLLAGSVAIRAMGAQQGLLFEKSEYDVYLLTRQPIQKELKMSAAVAKQIYEIGQASRIAFSKVVDADPATRGPDYSKKSQEAFEAMMESNRTQFLAAITPEQTKRLHELTLQEWGPESVLFPGVAKELGLTTDQITAINGERQKLAHNSKGLRQVFFKPGAPSVHDSWQIRQDDKKKLSVSIPKLLTSEQRKQWKRMMGKTISQRMLNPEPKK